MREQEHFDVAKVLIENGGADVNAVNEWYRTALHIAARDGHVEILKLLLQNGADVNAVGGLYDSTALHEAVECEQIRCALHLLCFGAQIDEKAIEDDKTRLLRPINDRLTLLRNGNRIGTSLMTDEERRFMWNLALVLVIKHPAIAFRTHQRIRSFVTFHDIFMASGYGLGEGSIWRRKRS